MKTTTRHTRKRLALLVLAGIAAAATNVRGQSTTGTAVPPPAPAPPTTATAAPQIPAPLPATTPSLSLAPVSTATLVAVEVQTTGSQPAQPAPPGTPPPAGPPPAVVMPPLPVLLPPLTDDTSGEGLRFQFRGAPLSQVLDYLSAAAGFAIIREASITGTVDVVSHKLLTKDEAVLLLDTILAQKGLAAVRSGERTLTIVKRDEARVRDLPIRVGSDPELIPKTDEMVTQIMPVRYASASQLMQNVQMLLPQDTLITVNDNSNAIILTDTQINVRRVAEIIKALDTQISGVSTVKVYTIRRSNARDMANIINTIFSTTGGGGPSGGGPSGGGPGGIDPQRIREFLDRIRGGGGGPPGGFGGPPGMFGGFGDRGRGR